MVQASQLATAAARTTHNNGRRRVMVPPQSLANWYGDGELVRGNRHRRERRRGTGRGEEVAPGEGDVGARREHDVAVVVEDARASRAGGPAAGISQFKIAKAERDAPRPRPL